MGINVVIGCESCRERVWVLRGHEAGAYRMMSSRHERHALMISDDQAGGWAEDDSGEWRELMFPREDESPH